MPSAGITLRLINTKNTSKNIMTSIIGMILALLPLAGVLLAVRLIDRWEPEPVGLLTAAFLWGAGVSTVISLVVNTSTANSSYLTKLQHRGIHWEAQDPVKIVSEDTSSMDTYQIREASYSMNWSVASTDMQTIADWYIDEYAQPVPTFKVELLPAHGLIK